MKSAQEAKRAGRVVLQLYREYQPMIEEKAKEMGATCRDGCNHCCRLAASMTLPEAAVIAEKLIDSPSWAKRKPALERAVRDQVKVMADAGLDIYNRHTFFERQLACVFLEGGRCSIYAVRPVVCRTHYVVTPPENCALGAANSEVAMIDFRKLENHIQLEGTAALGRLLGGPIPSMLAVAMWELGEDFVVDPEVVAQTMWLTDGSTPQPQGSFA